LNICQVWVICEQLFLSSAVVMHPEIRFLLCAGLYGCIGDDSQPKTSFGVQCRREGGGGGNLIRAHLFLLCLAGVLLRMFDRYGPCAGASSIESAGRMEPWLRAQGLARHPTVPTGDV
jgi:hypothetical protein